MRYHQMTFLVAAALLCSCVTASAQEFKSDTEINVWISTYYQHPEPGRIAAALKYFGQSTTYSPEAIMPLVAFFAATLEKDEALLQRTFDSIAQKGSAKEKSIFLDVLFFLNSKKSLALMDEAGKSWSAKPLQKTIDDRLAKTYPELKTIAAQSPQALDMLWAVFFATGEPWTLDKMIAVLGLAKDGKGSELTLGGAAAWSLGSNAKQHPLVRKICQQKLARAKGTTKEMLEKIVKESAPDEPAKRVKKK